MSTDRLTMESWPIYINHMVDNRAARSLDRVFRALASEPRRDMLRLVAREQRAVGELARHFDMSLAAVSKHIRVLEDAELISHTNEGRLHLCRLNPRALEPARASIEELRGFWSRQFDGLEAFLAGEPRNRRAPKHGRSGRR